MKLLAGVVVGLVAGLSACGQQTSGPSATDKPSSTPSTIASPETTPAEEPGALDVPPPLTLHRPEGDVDLQPYTWCFATACADGMPPDDPPETSAAETLSFSFPLEGWSFTASFIRPGGPRECERLLTTSVEPVGDETFVVPALGPAGRWQVDIAGNADAGGDLYTTFTWTTSTDSATVPPARGEAYLFGPPSDRQDKDGLEGYGPDLRLWGLGAESSDATAELVLSDGSASTTYPMQASKKDDCPQDGSMYFSGEARNQPVKLDGLGDPPYTYEVHLTMDGRTYVGTGRWPDDLAPPLSNQMPLTWSPPLPAWDGR